MKKFVHEDFLLSCGRARELYHGFAEGLPIIDYHCHLPPAEIAGDKRWTDIADAWLGADHYKWRLMRTDGVDERYVTGPASGREKFRKFAEAMPHALRNPMYHWCHLELARYFGIDDLLLSGDTADEVWERSAAVIAQPWFSARGLVAKSGVEALCTTDDPVDSLEHHAALAADKSFGTVVLPAWRPDKGFAIGGGAAWNGWVDKLAAAAGRDVVSFDDFVDALRVRHDFFAARGCRISDYGLSAVVAEPCTESELRAIFAKARAGGAVSPEEEAKFRSRMLVICGEMDAKADWTWQLHFNALRNNSTRIFRAVGPDAGVDSIGDWPVAAPLARILDELDSADSLPRTVLYSLNPRDNELLVAMAGNFQRGPAAGKIQVGSAWWFNDQMDGMLRQMEAVSQLGLLYRFVGMLTDSRSFLSYTRHEYFRRILCDMLGRDMERGVLPDDLQLVGSLVKAVCHDNAASFFGLRRPPAAP
ncbi:MAG: glucuronate isomerase [Kiritimatiellae bacterium]|nr:glucuronate isomerase [Kiritimatiellia bacterium]